MAPTQGEDLSLFHTERISQYVSLSPICLSNPLPAICATVFSPLLLTYFPPARGVVLAYEDVELSDKPPAPQNAKSKSKSNSQSETNDTAPAEPLLLRHVDECSSPFLWATASFLVWRPERNKQLLARITDQAKTHITLSHLNAFPVSILNEHLPSDWSWQSKEAGKMKKGWDGRLSDMGGWWVDGEGEQVKNGRELKVRIRDFEGKMDGKGKGFIRVDGSMLSEEEEKASAPQKGGKGKQKATAVPFRTHQQRAQANGEVMEID
jgi:DNA-directed RNA polymerase I subunit RPA43